MRCGVCVVCLCVCVCMCVRVCWARVCATLHPKDLQVTNLVALIMYRISFERCKILAREPQGSRANIFAPWEWYPSYLPRQKEKFRRCWCFIDCNLNWAKKKKSTLLLVSSFEECRWKQLVFDCCLRCKNTKLVFQQREQEGTKTFTAKR